jgi:hypothetical protein
MGCAIAAELAGLVSEFGLVVLVLRAVRTVTITTLSLCCASSYRPSFIHVLWRGLCSLEHVCTHLPVAQRSKNMGLQLSP